MFSEYVYSGVCRDVIYIKCLCVSMWVYEGVVHDGVCVNVNTSGVCVCVHMYVWYVYACTLHISEMRLSALGHKLGLPSFFSFRLTADSHL